MSVDLKLFIDCIERFSPPASAMANDFVGVQVGPQGSLIQKRFKVRKCAIATCVTPQVILKAASYGANILITYHGLLSEPINALTDTLLDKVRLLIENKVAVYVVHTSWLTAECGVNDTVADILGTPIAEAFNVEFEDRSVPLGRICGAGKKHDCASGRTEDDVLLSDLVERISERLGCSDIPYVGNLYAPIQKIVILAGEYGRTEWLRLAKMRHVDTYLTGDISRAIAVLSNELRLNYVCADHDIMESLGMRRLMQLLSIDLPEVEFTFVDNESPWKKYHSLKPPMKKSDL
ncbi:MAG: Nif3-like dinuclear metal center hexameric protein [Candidatus Atabeyarchaeum deiterrae]